MFDYTFMSMTMALIHMYFVRTMEHAARFPKWVEYYVLVISTMMSVLWILSRWNGMFYTITDTGYAHTGNFIWSQIHGVIVIVVDIIILFVNKDKLPKNEVIAWGSYGVFWIIALVIEFIVNVPSLYVAVALALFVMYLEIELQKNIIIARQEAELAESKSKLALSQIKPHFIYNCLAVIQVLIKKDPNVAVESVIHFSNFLRRTMDYTDRNEMISFEEEMKTIDNYLYMEKLRMQSRLSVEIELESTDFCVPALTVQPLVENAVKHGIRAKKDGGTVTIRTYELAEENIVEISEAVCYIKFIVRSAGGI